MTNLLLVLPDFDPKPYTHILPSLEKALVSTADLLTLDASDNAKRAQVPAGEVSKLVDGLLEALHGECGLEVFDGVSRDHAIATGTDLIDRWRTISTLDDGLDAALNGGIAAGHVTEFVGERCVSILKVAFQQYHTDAYLVLPARHNSCLRCYSPCSFPHPRVSQSPLCTSLQKRRFRLPDSRRFSIATRL